MRHEFRHAFRCHGYMLPGAFRHVSISAYFRQLMPEFSLMMALADMAMLRHMPC
jgi:hypothetical protein